MTYHHNSASRFRAGIGRQITRAFLLAALSIPLATYAQRPGESDEEYMSRTKWWQDARIGVCMHWGLGCKFDNDKGCQLSWDRGKKSIAGPCVQDKCGTPAGPGGSKFTKKYDDNVSDFNPTKFDADSIVRMVKNAGFGYLVLTVKHHEGFAMWRTKEIHSKAGTGDWPAGPHAISMSDWGKADTTHDPVMLLAKACKKYKLPFGIYYSPRDWFNPDYAVGDNSVYEAYMMGQLTELLNGDYGRMNVVWWDGFGIVPGKTRKQMDKDQDRKIGEAYWHYSKVLDSVYALSPWIISNPRCTYWQTRKGVGDYDVGETGDVTSTRLFERIYGTLHGAWGWQPGNVNPFSAIFKSMIGNVTKGGNYLMNIDPKPDGTIDERQIELIESMGEWTSKYGRSIINTRKGPWSGGSLASTCRNDTVFIHLINTTTKNWSVDDKGITLVDWEEMSPGTKSVTQSGGKINISLSSVEALDHVIAVKVDKVLYDTTQYYQEKWDPYVWFRESNWPSTSPVTNRLSVGKAGVSAAVRTIRVCGDNLVLPASWGREPLSVSLYTLDGALVRHGVVRNGRANLSRDFGLGVGAYVVRRR